MDKSRYLYVISTKHAGEWGGPVKVGITRNLSSRLSSIKTGSAFPITYFNTWEMLDGCAEFIEEAFHALQKDHKLFGEWYDLTPRQACVIIELYLQASFVLSGVATAEEIDRHAGPLSSRVPTQPVWESGR
jgi:hypothetical protein